MCFNFTSLDENLRTSFNRVKDDVHFLMRSKEEHEKLVFKMKTEYNNIFVKLNELSDIPQRLNITINELNSLNNIINGLKDSFAELNKIRPNRFTDRFQFLAKTWLLLTKNYEVKTH